MAGWWNDTDETNILEHGNFIATLWTPEGNPKYTLPWLQRTTAEGQQHRFCFFWGHQPANDGSVTKSCFSQWWMADFNAMEQTYCCMEQYMMAGKAELFDDKETRGKILESRSPKKSRNWDGASKALSTPRGIRLNSQSYSTGSGANSPKYGAEGISPIDRRRYISRSQPL